MNQYTYRETFKNILKYNNNQRLIRRLLIKDKIVCSVYSSYNFSTSQNKQTVSYNHGSSTRHLLGKTIGQLLEEKVEMHPDKDAVIVSRENVRLTFEQLLEQADRLAMGLISIGVRKGDRVGIWSPNNREWALAQYATARAGFILVNINPAYQIGELQFALHKVGVKALISAEQFKTQDYFSMLEKVCPELNSCKAGQLKSQSLPEFQSLIMISDKQHPGSFTFSEIMDAGDQSHKGILDKLRSSLQFDDPINIQFTSGTTGSPKGATLSHHNIVNNSNLVGYRCGYDVNPARIAVPVPLYHCFGMVLGSLMNVTHGATLIYPSPSFEPKATLEAVDKEKATSLYGTPTMFIDMQNHPDFDKYDLSSLYTGIMAGSTCPTEIMKKCINKMCMKSITICYGSTETSPVSFQTRMDDDFELRVKTIGLPLDHTEVKVVDNEGNIVPNGVVGELYTRGHGTMLGYWNDEGKTKESIGPDNWYKTGDLVSLDENGYAVIEGRKKDMLIRGGENIYPVEIEQFLYENDKIEDAQVIGVPDERLGEEICAWIKLKEGETADEEEIKDFCKGKISHFKIPRYIIFVDEFPMTVTGKIQKFKIREESVTLLNLE